MFMGKIEGACARALEQARAGLAQHLYPERPSRREPRRRRRGIACAPCGRADRVPDFQGLRARLGRLHPRPIRPNAARLLCVGFQPTAAPSRSSISTAMAAASTWRRLCSTKSLPPICSKRGGSPAPLLASSGWSRSGGWRRHLGGPIAGLIALVLLATCPLYYGHMFINPKDAPFAVAMAVLLLGLVRALDEYPRPALATVLIFGLGLGCAIGSRVLGGIAALYMVLPMAMLLMSDLRAHGARAMWSRPRTFCADAAARHRARLSRHGLIWPWSVLDPLNPIRAIGYFSEFFEKPWKEMFGGDLLAVPDMPRSYVPVYLRPEAAGNPAGACRRGNNRRSGRNHAREYSDRRAAPPCCWSPLPARCRS